MELILWRHAQALDTFPDDERKLTPKGRKDAETMAKWLKKRLPDNFSLWTSPLARSLETALFLGEPEVTSALLPHAPAEVFFRQIGWPAEDKTVVAVGHQPFLGLAGALILFADGTPLAVGKASVWWFVSRPGKTPLLKAVISPSLL